jgi:signal transduction histidine kinase
MAAPDAIVPDAMVYLVTSSTTPYWRHSTAYRPGMMRTLAEGRVTTVAPYDDDAGTWIAAYAPIRDRAGVIVGLLEVDASMDRILERIDQYTTQQVGFALLLFLVLLCAIIVLSARITASTTKLADAASRFGQGDYATEIAATGPPEVRELARALEIARRKIARHIGAQARNEAELAATLERAEAATRVKSQFLANMSHELRTPMNAIIGYSEMLMEDAEDSGEEALIPDLKKIRAAGQHLLALINDILDLSKIEAGKMDFLLEDFSLPETIEEVLDTIGPIVAQNQNRVEVDVDPHLGLVHADVIRVRQILVNLLGNAAKFTEGGVIRLRAWLSHEGDEPWVDDEDTDTGIGMTPEQKARLFTAFSQADASTTRKYGGTGLGLALCKEFAQRMNGDIGCTSEPGVGSTFTLRLPQRVTEELSAVDPAVRAHEAAHPGRSPRRAEPSGVC